MATPWHALGLLLLLHFQPARATTFDTTDKGRYQHCAVVFQGYMIVYGGKHYLNSHDNRLKTLGYAITTALLVLPRHHFSSRPTLSRPPTSPGTCQPTTSMATG